MLSQKVVVGCTMRGREGGEGKRNSENESESKVKRTKTKVVLGR